VRAIKAAGGIVMAQTPESTEYDGMPRSAIATGLVDYVLPPEAMIGQLMALAASGATPRAAASRTPATEAVWTRIFNLLNAQTGHDFSQYKPNTIARRVERRMAVLHIEQLDRYVQYLAESPSEVEALFRDLLIGVTGFFRDPDAFRALEAQVIPRLLAEKPSGATIRVWVPGCSTGEEAYSIAIALQEQIAVLQRNSRFQIFATDIDGRSIEHARAGIYPASIASDISAERLARFFSQERAGGDYRVSKGIRDLLVFSEQDLIRDPPFSKLDLISCRNLMIYLGSELQERLVPLFHYAMRPGGFLFLGTSETVGEFGDLFETLDARAKIYCRKPDNERLARPAIGRFVMRPAQEGVLPRSAKKPAGTRQMELRGLVEAALLAEYAVSAALINELGDVLYLHGRTGQYLEPAPGEASFNILTMAREGLRRELTTALRQATTRKAVVPCVARA
jgi:two-component system CheB/CheR fusion protein